MEGDSKRKGPSGAQKRKKKEEAERSKSARTLDTEKFKKFFKIPTKVEDVQEKKVDESPNLVHGEDIFTPICDVPKEPTKNSECPKIEENLSALSETAESDSKNTTDEIAENENVSDDGAMDYFIKPATGNLGNFFTFHPKQPFRCGPKPLPFNHEKAYYRLDCDGNRIRRDWLSFNENTEAMFCSFCLAFTKTTNVFTTKEGFKSWSHTYQRIAEHEESTAHKDACKAFIREEFEQNIDRLINTSQYDLRKIQIMKKRNVLIKIIDTVKLIGKQGIAIRGHRHEAGYDLDNVKVNHGNFLEILLEIAKSDEDLNEHINECIKRSKAMKLKDSNRKGKKSAKRGRGSLVTFMSKNTVVHILDTIKTIMLKKIVSSIKEANEFSVMMDSTTDISVYDQCCIVVRFVEKDCTVNERTIALKRVSSSTGADLHNLLTETLEKNELSMEKCVAGSFDGAANMSGQYQGVSAHLKAANPSHIQTWCQAHVLNLVMTDSTLCTVPSISLFGLLQETCNFFKESYKRMQIFENTASKDEKSKKKRMKDIGKTRWNSKSDGLTTVFGFYHQWNEENSKKRSKLESTPSFVNVIESLNKVSTDDSNNSKLRHEATSLLNRYLSFETILTAIMYLSIFSITTPVSKYLQTTNLDFVQAWRQVDQALGRLKDRQRSFSNIYSIAKHFVEKNQEILNERNIDLVIEDDLPKKRNLNNDIDLSPERKFEVKVYNVTFDKAINSISERFSSHRELYGDLACFDPRRFKNISEKGLPEGALKKICELIPSLKLDEEGLKEEFISFVKLYPTIAQSSLPDIYDSKTDSDYSSTDENESESDDETKSECGKESKKCEGCIRCALKVLSKFRLSSVEFENVYRIYKFLLTLPMTQVKCERNFSKLKMIKTRLRATLTNENLESLLLMSVERDIVCDVENEEVINRLCTLSEEYSKNLIL